MIYTNNQGPKIWANMIKNYFDAKINYRLFDNIIGANRTKLIYSKTTPIKILEIKYNNNNLDIEFNNNIIIKLELNLTSERITSNIPVLYKINLINNF